MTIAQIEALIVARADGNSNTVSTERDLWRILRNEACKLYEVKEIDVNLTTSPSYFADNFDATGLGKNNMVGFAVCNGNNGTKNRTGLTAIGYGTGFAIGATGGSADAVVVQHSHGIKYASNGVGTKYPETPYIGDNIGGDMQGTSETGVSGTNKNMQPYIVTLMIQRIA